MARASSKRTVILVLDGEERSALAVARSLVSAGYDVHVAAQRRFALATVTRGVKGAVIGPSSLRDPEGYVGAVAALARDVDAKILIPMTDASTEALLERPNLLPSHVEILAAPRDAYRAASDKRLVHERAMELGIGIKETAVVEGHGDRAPDDARLYPGVVKPHRSVVGTGVRTKVGVRFVDDAPSCQAALDSLPPEAFPVLVQRRVRGPGEGVFIARWGGRNVAVFAHQRLREKPPAGGVSVFRESVALDPELKAACDGLLDRLGWGGVAMIEFKRDLDQGGWRVMEINGRFWGSLQLAIDSGVDFPAILVRAALGVPLEPPPSWRNGVRLRWEWGDVDHLLLRLVKSRTRLSLPADAPGRGAAVIEFLKRRAGRDRLEIWRMRDPGPFLFETLQRLGLLR